jgi:predicted dehydrogenase
VSEAGNREQGTGNGGDGPVRVAVVGAGVFGRNHLRVYRELERAGYPVELAAVVDPDAGAREWAAAEYGVRGFASIEECMAARAELTRANAGILPLRAAQGQNDKSKGSAQNDNSKGSAENDKWIDAASVCVPTVHHAECARTLMAAGVDLLIEKPLAASLADADEMVRLAGEHGRIVQVGHLERFNPAVRAVRKLLNRPMFFEVHRLSVFTPRSLDVDVVLDLMIHDLDIVLSLTGQPVREVRAVGLPVLSKKVDIANVRLEFENGCVANFTASRVSTERVRKMRFFQPHQYLSLDFARQDLLLIDVSAAAGMDMKELAALAAMQTNLVPGAGGHPSPGMAIRKVAVEAGEPLRLEIESFLDAVRTRTQPVVTVEDGRAALKLALEINSAIGSHARRTGL